MKSLITKKDKIALVFIIISIFIFILFIAGIVFQKQLFVKKIAYYTTISNGEGLRTRSEVLLSGINIGYVDDMVLTDENKIRVKVKIYKQFSNRIKKNIRFVFIRKYGIGEKKIVVKTINDINSVLLPENSEIISVEQTDIIEKISELDLNQFVETLSKTTIVLNELLGQLQKEGRIDKLGEILDKGTEFVINFNDFFKTIRVPIEIMIKKHDISRLLKTTTAFFGNRDLQIILKKMAKLSKEEDLSVLVSSLNKLAANENLEKAISGANKFFNDTSLYVFTNQTAKLLSSKRNDSLVYNLNSILGSLKKVSPNLPEATKELLTTLKEFNIVLKALQKTWLLNDESKEVIENMKKQYLNKK